MTYSEAQKVLKEGWWLDRKATDADREKAKEVLSRRARPAVDHVYDNDLDAN